MIGHARAGLLAVPTLLSGEGAEDRVENIAGVSKVQIEAHEDAGRLAGYGVGYNTVNLGGQIRHTETGDGMPTLSSTDLDDDLRREDRDDDHQ